MSELKKLLAQLKKGILVFIALALFTKLIIDGIHIIKHLFEREVIVHILNICLVENAVTGIFVLNVMSEFMGFESEMKLERTQ